MVQEHESNMLMLRAQERELRKSEGRFNEHLNKKNSAGCASLPAINQAEVRKGAGGNNGNPE